MERPQFRGRPFEILIASINIKRILEDRSCMASSSFRSLNSLGSPELSPFVFLSTKKTIIQFFSQCRHEFEYMAYGFSGTTYKALIMNVKKRAAHCTKYLLQTNLPRIGMVYIFRTGMNSTFTSAMPNKSIPVLPIT